MSGTWHWSNILHSYSKSLAKGTLGCKLIWLQLIHSFPSVQWFKVLRIAQGLSLLRAAHFTPIGFLPFSPGYRKWKTGRKDWNCFAYFDSCVSHASGALTDANKVNQQNTSPIPTLRLWAIKETLNIWLPSPDCSAHWFSAPKQATISQYSLCQKTHHANSN